MNTRDSYFSEGRERPGGEVNTEASVAGIGTSEAEPQNLLAPIVPLAVSNGGIRNVDLEDVEGFIEVQVPWSNLFSPNDQLRLYWGREGVVVDVHVILNNDVAYLLQAPVPDVRTVGDGMIEVWYDRLSAQGEPLPQESPRIQVLVKTQIPGGDDPDQTTFPVNEGLAPAIVPEGKIEPPIPAEGIAVEVLPWINMTQGDRLRLFWGSQPVQMPAIDESQVGSSVIVMVPPSVIEAAGDSEALVVTYEIRDVVNNWSGRAPAAFANVETGEAIYLAPGVLQLEDGVLDFDALAGNAATAVVMKNGDMATGDEVTLTFEGKSYDGRDVEHSESKALTGTMMMFDLPNAVIAQVVPGEASVFYRVSAGGVAKGRSFRERFAITGTAVELPAPRVLEAPDDATLDPTDAANGATVDVPLWSGIAVRDLVRLRWDGIAADGSPVTYADILEVDNASGPVHFRVPYSQIGRLGGGTVKVTYTVQQGSSERTSAALSLNVLVAQSLPPAIVEGEVGGKLDPMLVPNGAKVTIPAWPDMAVGDVVKWYWIGTSDGGQALGEETVSSVGDVVVTAPRGVIEINANGSDTVNVLYEVVHAAGGTSGSLPKTFVVGPLVFMLPPPVVDEAIDDLLDPNDVLDDATVRVRAYEGMAMNDIVMVWFGQNTVGETFRQFQVSQNMVGEDLLMYVPHEKVALLDGVSVIVNYIVKRGDAEILSEDLVLEISQAVVWPVPYVEEASEDDGEYLPEDAYARGATTVVPWHTGMRIGDTIHLYWGEGADEYHDSMNVVGPMDFVFTVPKAVVDRWLDDVVPVRYTVTRGNRVMPSEVLNLRIGIDLPRLDAPEVLEAINGVLKPVSAGDGATVRISYDGMTPEDSIQVSWDGDTSVSAVAGNANASGTVEVTIPPGSVAMALGRTIPVQYTVTRRGFDVVSPSLNLTVENFLPSNLPKVWVVQERDGALNLKDFAGNATSRQPPWPLMAAGQRIWWRVFGTQANGSTIQLSLELGHVITEAEVGKPLERPIPRAQLELMADGSEMRTEVKVTFDGSSAEADAVAFRIDYLTIAHHLTLPKPLVLEAPDDELDAIDAADGVTVRVEYGGMQPTDTIELFWDGESLFDPVPGSATGSVDFDISADKVIPYVGTSVTAHYTVMRNGEVAASGILTLTINEFAQGQLPTPEIPQAEEDVLDLESFEGNPVVTVAPWPLMEVGQTVWLRCHGTLADGEDETIVLLEASEVTPSEVEAGLSVAIPRARLEALENESELRVELKVAFDGSTEESHAVVFPVLQVMMQVVPEFVVDPDQMILDGVAVKENWPRSGGYAPGNMKVRAGSGGLAPYTYSSSKPSVASVNGAGRVVGEGNGTATITITDSRGVAVSYEVVVSNVYRLAYYETPGLTPAQAIAWKNSLPGGRGVGYVEVAAIQAEYTAYATHNDGYFEWTCDNGNCPARYSLMKTVLHPNGVRCVSQDSGNGSFAKAFCLIPRVG